MVDFFLAAFAQEDESGRVRKSVSKKNARRR